MAVRLPDLSNSPCHAFIMCGTPKTGDAAMANWLREQESVYARYGKGGRHYVALLFSEPDGPHFHVEVSNQEWSSDDPVRKVKLSDIQQVFKTLYGKFFDFRMD